MLFKVDNTVKTLSSDRFCLKWLSLGLLCFLLHSPLALTKEFQRAVNLEFESIQGATGYEVKIQRVLASGKKKPPITFQLKKPIWEASVNYGKYELSLRTFDDRGVPGDWSESMEFVVAPLPPQLIAPQPHQKIKTAQENSYQVPFQWQAVPGASSYELIITDTSNNKSKTYLVKKKNHYDADLEVAKTYEWKVISLLSEGLKSDSDSFTQTFQLIGKPLQTPDVDEPSSKFPQKITWNKPKHADSYTYALYYKTNSGKWKQIKSQRHIKEPQIPFNLAHPTGEYQIKVRAEGQGRQPSQLASQTFKVQGGLRSPAAIEAAQLKDSLNKPTNFYAIASYFITQMNYSGDRYETGKRSTFQGVGGTGRLGLGYQKSFQQWGAFGIVDLGGINIGEENYTFASAELHGTWQLHLTPFSLLQVSTGLYMKELPELQGNDTAGITGVNKAKNLGPHLGFKYWVPYSYKYGLQLNGRVYYSLLGTAPNGKEVQPSISYQLGVLGSVKLTKKFMGYAGYAYRVDESHYSADSEAAFSNAQPGDINVIQLQGHYLNLILEYSF